MPPWIYMQVSVLNSNIIWRIGRISVGISVVSFAKSKSVEFERPSDDVTFRSLL